MRAVVLLGLMACTEAPVPVVSPSDLPSSGYVTVQVDLTEVDADIGSDDVWLGPHRLLGVSWDGPVVSGTFQGAMPGPVDLGVGDATYPERATVQAAADPRLTRLVTVGASLGMGVQGGTPSARGALNSPSAHLARAVGSYHTLPLLVPDLLPQIGADDIGPPPVCSPPGIPAFVGDAATGVISVATDPETGTFDYRYTRQDPELVPMNLAVGDFRVGTLLRGPDRFSQTFLAHLVYDAEGAIADPLTETPLDLLAGLEPDTIVVYDLFGNDVITPIVQSPELDPSFMTPLAEAEADLTTVIETLVDTGAQVFVATLPQPSLIALTEQQRRGAILRLIREGVPQDEAVAQVADNLAAIDAQGAALNQALVDLADGYDSVHVIAVSERIADIQANGLDVGGTALGVTAFSGLLSTDGVHFSDTGYALLADLTLDAMDQAWGTQLPRPDLVQVLATDPYSPDALRAAGIPLDECR